MPGVLAGVLPVRRGGRGKEDDLVRSVLCIALSALLLGTAQGQVKKPKFMPKAFQPVVMTHVQEYAGRYVGIDTTYVVDVWVGSADKLTVNLHEGPKTWAVHETKLTGAVLDGTAVTRDGKSKKFEAVFGNRDLNNRRIFGLLVNEMAGPDEAVVNRLFCARKKTPPTPSPAPKQ
jgi:hypothetical protein